MRSGRDDRLDDRRRRVYSPSGPFFAGSVPDRLEEARPHGNPGIYGNAGNLESVTYRFYRGSQGSNPTLSASFKLLKINDLVK